MHRLISFSGLFVMMGLAWRMSSHKRRIQWRTIGGGLALQFAFAFLTLRTAAGRGAFAKLGDVVTGLLQFVDEGAVFVFGVADQGGEPNRQLLATYVKMGIDAGHLVTASVIAAPASIVIAKIMQPEVEQPPTRGRMAVEVETGTINAIEAAANGALDGLKLAIQVAGIVIAFLALIAMLKFAVAWTLGVFGAKGNSHRRRFNERRILLRPKPRADADAVAAEEFGC